MPYAAYTKVPEDKSRTEIEGMLTRYGADRFMWLTDTERVIVVFEARERRVKFEIPMPTSKSDRDKSVRRSKWRALLLCIKAKLESVESKIETFEEAFLAHVVMPDGKTVHDHAAERIDAAYKGGEIAALLPPPAQKQIPRK